MGKKGEVERERKRRGGVGEGRGRGREGGGRDYNIRLASVASYSLSPPTSTCSHLELGLVEVLSIDLAKDVVDPPCLHDKRAKEEGESQ